MRMLFAFAALVLLASCSGPGCPLRPHTDPERALRMHRSLGRTLSVLRAEARVDQRGAQGRVRGTVLLYLERPGRVRFDAMTQFGPAAVLTSDGERFQLLDMREERFLEGPTCPSNIGRLLGIPLSGEQVARFLVGDTPRIEATSQQLECDRRGYVVTLRGEGGARQEIVLRPRSADRDAPPEAQHLRLVRSELFHPDGRTDWRAEFDDYEVVPDPGDAEGRGVALPFVFRFVDPDQDTDTEVRFKEIEIVQGAVADDVFRQQAPPGMAIERVACESGR